MFKTILSRFSKAKDVTQEEEIKIINEKGSYMLLVVE